ncbi:MFS transporter, partial [candidate division KSB1 bacterium]|nr:MFS transporter [candidate division KSB1 bacterium]
MPVYPKSQSSNKPQKRNPWLWVPSLYYAEGIPYVIVMTVSVIMYKRLGISNTDIALYTSWLYLPWVIKPLWSPVVDIIKTKRLWIIVTQLIIGAGLAGVALTIPVSSFFQYTLAFFWLLAFSSATHDIAADGFYMLGLSKHDQAFFVGIRSTFYRLAMITGQGLLIILAGYVESHTGLPPVDVRFSANQSVTNAAFVPADSIDWHVDESSENHLIFSPAEVVISTQKRSKNEIDSLLALVKSNNSLYGFIKSEQTIAREKQQNQDHISWWRANVTQPLEVLLRKQFGTQPVQNRSAQNVGNVGFLYFRLAQKPAAGEDVVVNFGRSSGDNSINLIEGARFIFTEQNWDKPFIAAVQLDPKLQAQTSAQFVARAGNIPLSWVVTFFVLTGLFAVFFIYHRFMLPYPAEDTSGRSGTNSIVAEFFETFASFFKKKNILIILAFLLLYRFAEAQLVKLAAPFLLDAQETGGLALTTGQVGFVYGTVGVVALTIGGLLGGFLAAKHGLKFWLWPMVIAINLPNAVYIFLSSALPQNFFIINVAVAIEQFGYGFGFTAYMLYMIYAAEGEHKTAHFAICTGFMALGMMLPGMFSGW